MRSLSYGGPHTPSECLLTMNIHWGGRNEAQPTGIL